VNYTFQDIFGILTVIPVFALVLLAPGYLLGSVFNLLEFRMRGFSERLLLSIVFSCSVSPYIINLSCRFLAVRTVSIVFLAIGFVVFVMLLLHRKRLQWKSSIRLQWTTKAALGLCFLWLLICLASLPDLQIQGKLYSTSATFDHSVRSAFIASALRTGAPPANPFFFPGHAINARYYYYWNVLCALPAFISRASPRIVLYASCFWSGICLASLIPIYLKHFLKRQTNLRLATLFGFILLAITGLDLIPSLLILLFPHTKPYADMEWWDPVQMTSWLDSLLWVPHHVAALVACLVGFLLLWTAVSTNRNAYRISLIGAAAICFSSAVGLSVYVTLTFAFFSLTWVVYLLISRKFLAASIYLAAGFVAVLMSVAYLHDLLGQNSTGGAGTNSFLAFKFRELPGLFAPFPEVLGQHSWVVGLVLHILLIALTLFLELGIYFAVGVFQWKQDWKQRGKIDEAQRCLWLMVLATLTVITFFRSTVIESNDLAWRGSMILQFVLLLWTAVYLTDRVTQNSYRPWRFKLSLGRPIATLILIGGLSSAYQLFFLRTFNMFNDSGDWQHELGMSSGAEAIRIRETYHQLDQIASADDIAQFNPEGLINLQFLVYSRYQLVDAFSSDCGIAFGGSLEQCRQLGMQLKRIYNPAHGDQTTGGELFNLCNSMKINWLMVDARDPVWIEPGSWVWQKSPAISNDFVRVYRCNADL
jgi:hypothetical protein